MSPDPISYPITTPSAESELWCKEHALLVLPQSVHSGGNGEFLARDSWLAR